jgi:hypothetical protein
MDMTCRSPCLNTLTTFKMKILVIDINADLTTTSSQKTLNLEPFRGKSDHEPNIIVIEYFLILPIVTCTP